MGACRGGRGTISLEDLQDGIRRATQFRHSVDELVYIYEVMLTFSSRRAVGFDEFEAFIRAGQEVPVEGSVVHTGAPLVYNVPRTTPSPEQQRAAARIREWSQSPANATNPSPGGSLAVTSFHRILT